MCRTHTLRPNTYRSRKTAEEVETYRLQRALQGISKQAWCPPQGMRYFRPREGQQGQISEQTCTHSLVVGNTYHSIPQRPYKGKSRRQPDVARQPEPPALHPTCVTCVLWRVAGLMLCGVVFPLFTIFLLGGGAVLILIVESLLSTERLPLQSFPNHNIFLCGGAAMCSCCFDQCSSMHLPMCSVVLYISDCWGVQDSLLLPAVSGTENR